LKFERGIFLLVNTLGRKEYKYKEAHYGINTYNNDKVCVDSFKTCALELVL